MISILIKGLGSESYKYLSYTIRTALNAVRRNTARVHSGKNMDGTLSAALDVLKRVLKYTSFEHVVDYI